ncbi:unnamed protein product [Paramecium octaurelia]|uniref:Tetratricopeptide repeat protein n=1 Tax=Paramecium octaurelia TaxID=43137 RepID=A0A8S1Y8K7_PAROT|nr:unnamed protein product [Paramecium octaurelia]
MELNNLKLTFNLAQSNNKQNKSIYLVQQNQIYSLKQNLKNYEIDEGLDLINEALKLNPLFSQAFISKRFLKIFQIIGELHLGKSMDDWTVEDAIKVRSLGVLRNASFDQKTKGITQKDLLVETLQNYLYSIQLTPQYGSIFQRIGDNFLQLPRYSNRGIGQLQ